jgi:hypothetical protein
LEVYFASVEEYCATYDRAALFCHVPVVSCDNDRPNWYSPRNVEPNLPVRQDALCRNLPFNYCSSARQNDLKSEAPPKRFRFLDFFHVLRQALPKKATRRQEIVEEVVNMSHADLYISLTSAPCGLNLS